MAAAIDKDTQRLLGQIREIGWFWKGKRTSNGHLILEHPETGKTYVMAGTASDWRGYRNALSAMENLVDRKVTRKQSGRSRHKRHEHQYNETFRPEKQEFRSQRIDELNNEYTELILEFRILTMAEASRTDVHRAIRIVRRLAQIENVLDELHQPIPDTGFHVPGLDEVRKAI